MRYPKEKPVKFEEIYQQTPFYFPRFADFDCLNKIPPSTDFFEKATTVFEQKAVTWCSTLVSQLTDVLKFSCH